jgi:hypothetical protein
MIYSETGVMLEIEPWPIYASRIPLVAVIGLVGEWMTIYACLQQAIKNFDYIIICGDGVSPKAKEMVDRFILDHSSIKNRIQFLDMDNIDPWPWTVMARPGIKYDSIDKVPIKAPSKACFKRINYAKTMFPNSITCSLHSDIVCFDGTGDRIRKRMIDIQDPFFDSEWYSMVAMNDKKTVMSVLSEDSGPGNHKGHPALRQRKTYDYPGDWGLMSIYASSILTVGPDPIGHETECLYPWSMKTQCEKKGCDTSIPHAIHFEWLRDSCRGKDFSNVAWKHIEREWLDKNDPELGNHLHVIDNVYFPVEFRIDKNNILRISE